LLDGLIGADFDDPVWWRPRWVAFTLSFGDDHWCVDLDAADGGTPGR
jgi:cell wall assembly regulator SMI1